MADIEKLLLDLDVSTFDYAVEKMITTVLASKTEILLNILELMSNLLNIRFKSYKLYAEAFACLLNSIPKENIPQIHEKFKNIQPLFAGFLVSTGVMQTPYILSQIGNTKMQPALLACYDTIKELRPNVLQEIDPKISNQIKSDWSKFYDVFINDDNKQIFRLTGKYLFPFGDELVENHPIYFAAIFGCPQIFTSLLKKGVQLNSPMFKTKVFESLAQAAVVGGSHQILKRFDSQNIDLVAYKDTAIKYKVYDSLLFIYLKENPKSESDPKLNETIKNMLK